MNDKFKLFWLGLFILGAIVILAWFLLFLRPSIGNAEKELRVRFADIDRVNTGTQVTYAGKPIGEVHRIDRVHNAREQTASPTGAVYSFELTLSVDSSVSVYTYDEIHYVTAGLLGEKAITIVPRGTPSGMPPAQDISNEILYGISQDQLEIALDEILEAAETFGNAMEQVESVIKDNRAQFEEALCTIASAAEDVREVLGQALEHDFIKKASHAAQDLSGAMIRAESVLQQMLGSDLVTHLSESVQAIESVTSKIASGQGTVGRLVSEDLLFEQLSTTLDALDTTLQDINEYGVLFQFNNKWQRKKRLQRCQLEQTKKRMRNYPAQCK